MKLALLFIFGVFSSSAMANVNCSYVLDDEAYWEDASGVLTVDTRKYNCKTMVIGQRGDMLTICSDALKKPQKTRVL